MEHWLDYTFEGLIVIILLYNAGLFYFNYVKINQHPKNEHKLIEAFVKFHSKKETKNGL